MIDWKSQLFEIKKSELNKYLLVNDMISDAKVVKLGIGKGWREENASQYLARKSFDCPVIKSFLDAGI
jgi:hypothetical protein